MKKIILFMFLYVSLMAQTTSNVKPKVLEVHNGEKYFNTSVYLIDEAYHYQSVEIKSFEEADLLNALLNDFDNRVEKSIDFVEYRKQSIQRVSYFLTGEVVGYTLEVLGLSSYSDE